MRVNTSHFHCPSYCFSKPPPPPRPPSPPPPPTPSPPPPPVQCQPDALQTEDSVGHTSCKSSPGPLVVEGKLCGEKEEIGENGIDGRKREFILKSSLKKTSTSASKDIVRECVKWMDDLGEELVEIREFEQIESGELDDAMKDHPTCSCVIL
ncbi:leiomodin-2-like [Phalaenopsis equestris]|uniref:leiomodin-2-like n=1 Tax=Phalaenopsis equestris TaxID=78828 RepID=UPI0009E1BBBC|nr:leiomodin-2-like [Phalaenopsis equestris]